MSDTILGPIRLYEATQEATNGNRHAAPPARPLTPGKRRDAYVEEVEWLRSYGVRDEGILEQIGVSASALAKALYRADRPDLARAFGRMQKRTSRACVDCGQPRNPYRAGKTGRCWECTLPLLSSYHKAAS